MNRLATLDAALAHIQSTSSASAADDKMRALRVANDLFGADDESRELLEVRVSIPTRARDTRDRRRRSTCCGRGPSCASSRGPATAASSPSTRRRPRARRSGATPASRTTAPARRSSRRRKPSRPRSSASTCSPQGSRAARRRLRVASIFQRATVPQAPPRRARDEARRRRPVPRVPLLPDPAVTRNLGWCVNVAPAPRGRRPASSRP